ncbi:MAG: hypothetical protein GXP17_03220 [Gammaproteobacteria bacterium]|nr:hypothetical protein [Gammaproteobacteria bacterium]
MLLRYLLVLLVLLSALSIAACGDTEITISTQSDADASLSLIEIYTPVSGAVLMADTPFSLEYAVLRSSNGHHVNIQIDKQKPVKVNSLKGFHRMPGLPAGAHILRIVAHTEDGTATSGQGIVRIITR